MNPLILGTLRGLGVVVIAAILGYFGDAAHLPFLNPAIASLIAAVALGLEGQVTAKTGNALFGAVKI